MQKTYTLYDSLDDAGRNDLVEQVNDIPDTQGADLLAVGYDPQVWHLSVTAEPLRDDWVHSVVESSGLSVADDT